MVLASIIIFFSLLALGLLALLDRYDTAILKAQAERRSVRPATLAYYDAFAARPKSISHTPPAAPANGDQLAA